jgi:cell volume regulation protein A
MIEPTATAAIIALFGVLLTISALMTRTLDRMGVPVVLLFLGLGMLGGSEGVGGLAFDDADFAFRIGTVALVLILLDGGLNTRWSSIRTAAAPAGLLATFGVVATAAVVALAGRAFGLSWDEAILVGAIVSSTDAAAVFSVLRGGGVRLDPKLQSTLEVESCANDPMAVILTLSAIQAIETGGGIRPSILVQIPLQLLIGTAVGLLVGVVFRYLLNTVRLGASGLYPVLTIAAGFTAFGASTLIYGSGFLAAFLAAVVLGNGHLPFAQGLRRVHDSIAWLSQVLMFLMLGLLVFPSRLLPLAWVGIGLGLVLALVARPVAALLCLSAIGWRPRESAFAGWVGLRGAVPIILATFPIIKGLSIGDRVFHIVFFIVVVSAIVPGASIIPIALRSRLGRRVKASPGAALELNVMKKMDRELHAFNLPREAPACGKTLRDLPLPESAAIVLIVRADQPFPARGSSQLLAEDLLYVVCPDKDLPALRALVDAPAPAESPAQAHSSQSP